MKTPQELYDAKPESVSNELRTLFGSYYNHVEESGLQGGDILWDKTSDRVEIRCLKDFSFDSRRFWRLATVWFDKRPVMVIQNAGREGDDHRRRIITDEDGFIGLCMHLITLRTPKVRPTSVVVLPTDEVEGLTEFYGNSLDGLFERY